jgi:tRNA(Ser,Leu) C12 N-acetylase TAN1
MQDWNIVVSVHAEGFRDAWRLLQRLGEVSKTDYFNVLVLKVEDPEQFLEVLRRRIEDEPGTLNFIGRVVPVTRTFSYRDAEEFEEKARQTALAWTPELASKSFHVRMHRRGFKSRLSSQQEEQRIAGALLEALEREGTPARITFQDPDAILAVETVGNRAGMSLWSREDLKRYPFLALR